MSKSNSAVVHRLLHDRVVGVIGVGLGEEAIPMPRPTTRVEVPEDPTQYGYRPLSIRERLMMRLGCSHARFTWPHRLNFRTARQHQHYSEYQSCTQCGAERLYDMATATPGPFFVRTPQSTQRA